MLWNRNIIYVISIHVKINKLYTILKIYGPEEIFIYMHGQMHFFVAEIHCSKNFYDKLIYEVVNLYIFDIIKYIIERRDIMWKEFKQFALKGNVIDLAVGIIIGGAFNKIVTSLVADIIMPIVGLLMGGIDLKGYSITFREAKINIGMFAQNIIDFLIIAFSVFILVKTVNKLTSLRKAEEKVEEEKKPTMDQVLLTEIRDLLKKSNNEC